VKRFVVIAALLLAAACGEDAILPGGGPRDVAFRAISEKQNAGLCVRGPEFAVARNAQEWGAVWARSTSCQPTPDAEPPLVAGESAVAAWWKVENCLGHTIRTTRVATNGSVITVTATASPPPAEFCATAIGGLESFLALPSDEIRAATSIRFVLNDTAVGAVDVPR
jgi:hypothetical protein